MVANGEVCEKLLLSDAKSRNYRAVYAVQVDYNLKTYRSGAYQ